MVGGAKNCENVGDALDPMNKCWTGDGWQTKCGFLSESDLKAPETHLV